MNKLIEKINMWYVVISFIIFVTFMVFVLPSMSNYMDEKTGGADSPDTSLIYSGNELYDMAEDYGKEGREAYILVRFTFDIVWPLVYTFFLLSTLAYLYKKNRLKPVYIFILFIPLSAMMFDFLENVATALTMHFYPNKFIIILYSAPIFTFLKWILIYLSFLLVLYLSFITLLKQLGRGDAVE